MLYFEDIAAGQTYRSPELRIDAAAITDFAARFDPQPFHLDEAAARDSLFEGLAASGWHTAALTMKLCLSSDFRPAGGIIGVGGELLWPRRCAACRDRGARNADLALAPAPGCRQDPDHDAEPARRPGPDLHADPVRRSPIAGPLKTANQPSN